MRFPHAHPRVTADNFSPGFLISIFFAFSTGLLISSCVWVLLHHALDQTRCSEKHCVVL